MRYHITEDTGRLLIKIFGDTRRNEALSARKMLARYLRKKGTRVIVDLEELNQWEPVTLVGVLNAIRKEVRLFNGELKLRALNPAILNYFKEHRLDQLFQFIAYGEEETNERSTKAHGEG